MGANDVIDFLVGKRIRLVRTDIALQPSVPSEEFGVAAERWNWTVLSERAVVVTASFVSLLIHHVISAIERMAPAPDIQYYIGRLKLGHYRIRVRLQHFVTVGRR